MAQTEALSELIGLLHHFANRPGLYIRPVDVQYARSFLGGVNLCVQAFTGPFTREELDADARSRGWRVSELSIPRPEETLERQMSMRGMSEAEMIAELVELDILSLRRRVESTA